MTIVSFAIKFSKFLKKVSRDSLNVYSAHTTFFILLSSFPFVMFLLSLMGRFNIPSGIFMNISPRFFPEEIDRFFGSVITEMERKSSPALISFAAITTLWSAARGMHTTFRGLNYIYDIEETRNSLKLQVLSALYTLALAVVIILTLVVIVFGSKLYERFAAHAIDPNAVAAAYISLRVLFIFAFLTLFFLFEYKFIPNIKTSFFAQLPGAILSSVGWIGFSYIFSYYIDNLNNLSYIYGSLTAIILTMLWLYTCIYIMFFGAEVNFELNHNKIKKPYE